MSVGGLHSELNDEATLPLDYLGNGADASRLFARALVQTPNAVVITDAAGVIRFVNPQFSEITGYSSSEALGLTPRILKSGLTPAATYDAMWETVCSGDIWRGELLNRRKNGQLYWARLSISPVVDQWRQTTHYLGIQEDVTEMRSMQQRLIMAQRRAGMAEVASLVVHNVGNILNSIGVAVAMMQERAARERGGRLRDVARILNDHQDTMADFLTDDPVGRNITIYLEKLGDQLSRDQAQTREELRTLALHISEVRKILQLQQQYARRESAFQEVSVDELIERALQTSAVMRARGGVDVRLSVGSNVCVETDAHKVSHILVHLFSNAARAMQERDQHDAVLEIRVASEDDEFIVIEIQDNGVGIAPDKIDRIYETGYTTKKHEGGFGLHSSALAARELGGYLSITSPGVNQGATCRLTLPRRMKENEKCPTPRMANVAS